MEVEEFKKPEGRGAHLKPYHFKVGQIPNPKGRPKGARSGISEAFMRDMLADWKVGGVSAIEACRRKDPTAYLKIVASIIPKQLKLMNEGGALDGFFEEFNDSQLEQLAGLLANISHEAVFRTVEDEEDPREKPT